jgi:ribosomal protein S10
MNKKKFIILNSINFKTLKKYNLYLNLIFKQLNLSINYIFLPKKTNKITLLKSPHVKKKNKESFKIIHSKVVISFKMNNENFKNLIIFLLINKPKSIKIKSKI